MSFERTGLYPIEDMYDAVLCIVTSPEGLLMGLKTRGFGTGQLVLPGGKRHFGIEGMTMAKKSWALDAQDEISQETSVLVGVGRMRWIGSLVVEYPEMDGDLELRQVQLIRAKINESPTPYSSDELLQPKWQPLDAIPYDDMPEDYRLWLPEALDGKEVRGGLINIDEGFSGSTLFFSRYDPKVERPYMKEVA